MLRRQIKQRQKREKKSREKKEKSTETLCLELQGYLLTNSHSGLIHLTNGLGHL